MDKKCRKCRKFGVKLFLKGERCLSPKCSLTRRSYPPGMKGAKTKTSRKSEYSSQLLEKQKAKAEYGLRERQFARIFKKASRAKATTGEELLKNLEMRMDNIVYRLGFASSRRQARQLVLHRKIKVNEKIVNIPSATLKPEDLIIPINIEAITPVKTDIPKWLKLDGKVFQGKVLRAPNLEEVNSDLDSEQIIKFYSR